MTPEGLQKQRALTERQECFFICGAKKSATKNGFLEEDSDEGAIFRKIQ